MRNGFAQRQFLGERQILCIVASVTISLLTASSALAASVTITLAQFKQRDRALEARLLREFEHQHPGVHVRLREMPTSSDLQHQQFVTWLAARDPSVDVYAIDLIWVAEFAAAGWIRPLDGFWPPAARKPFVPRLIDANSYAGRVYAIPRFTESGMLFFRKDLISSAPKTWSDLEEQAMRLQEPGLAGYVFQGKQYEGLVCNFLEFLWSNNGAVMDADGRATLDRPEAIEALTRMVRMARPEGIAAPGVTTYAEHDSLQEFAEGRAIFHRNWSYAWSVANHPSSRVRGRVGIAPLPAFPGGRSTAALGGWNLAISAFSSHPETAWKLIDHLTGWSVQRTKALAEGRLPTRLALYDDPQVLAANPHFALFRDAVIHARNRPVSPVYARISAAIQLHVSRALVGAEDPETAMRRAAKAVRKVLLRVPVLGRKEARRGGAELAAQYRRPRYSDTSPRQNGGRQRSHRPEGGSAFDSRLCQKAARACPGEGGAVSRGREKPSGTDQPGKLES